MGQVQREIEEQITNHEGNILVIQVFIIISFPVLIIFLIPTFISYFNGGFLPTFFHPALFIEKSISHFIKSIIPIEILTLGMIRWGGIIVSFFLLMALHKMKGYYREEINDLKLKKEYEEWRTKKRISGDGKTLITLKKKIERLSTSTPKEREELLKLFAETKKKLEAMGKTLSFLSIDVVGSAEMKVGEDKAVVEYNFREYNHFVERIFKANGVLKSTWTPDGSMSVFPTVEAAAKAAKEVITGLNTFNEETKTVKKDFKVRCGIHEGYVYFDRASPLEEMSDQVIDTAGHMQKNAAPNTIYISKSTMESIKEPIGFVPIHRVIDGCEVYVWEKE